MPTDLYLDSNRAIASAQAQRISNDRNAYATKCSTRLGYYLGDKETFWPDITARVAKDYENPTRRQEVLSSFEYMNFCAMVVDQLGSSYAGDVERKLIREEAVVDNPFLLKLYEGKDIDAILLKADRWSTLLNSSIIWFQPDGKDNLRRDVLSPHQIHIELDADTPNDIQKAKTIAVEIMSYAPSSSLFGWSLTAPTYIRYTRDAEGLVRCNREDGYGNVQTADYYPATRDYPFAKLDLWHSPDFYLLGRDELTGLPAQMLILAAYLNLSFKWTCHPVAITNLAPEDITGLQIGPGSVLGGPPNISELKFSYVSPSVDYEKSLSYMYTQLKTWALTFKVPPSSLSLSPEITSGIARQIARAPLEEYLALRRRDLIAFEQAMFKLWLRLLNDNYSYYGYDEATELDVEIEKFDPVSDPLAHAQAESAKVDLASKKLALAQQMLTLGLAVDLPAAMEMLDAS